ncbi:hypothetical protein RchiOBHm_Chr7g0231311 [Rosa chinensis]|uniref:Uncharacterized protein n=1 Tax=Rosa chinensis TaxID=74649 RepID=A0A2P6PFN7_ROSCH|nr:hypothetical protein RchiOBHm_Chr7g0231311 [Rosa chinensis]
MVHDLHHASHDGLFVNTGDVVVDKQNVQEGMIRFVRIVLAL